MHILDESLYQAGMALALCPVAPGFEQFTRASVEAQLAGLPYLTWQHDEFGNLWVRYAVSPEGRTPLRLVAHLDHPGFVVESGADGAPELHFAGGVAECFFAGESIRFYGTLSPEPLGHAVIIGTDFSEAAQRVQIEGEIPLGARFATWALPPPTCTGGADALFVSPACDDLAQVATLVALLQRLSASGAPGDVEALFTRAEEVGFYGAWAACASSPPLEKRVTLSLETSAARGFAEVGAGPIVRVGDRTSVFSADVTSWLEHAFRALQKERPETLWQRRLMGGGTCEATVFARAGFATGALCVALNAYHNQGASGKIEPESISLRDWQGLYDYLYFLITAAPSLDDAEKEIDARFSRQRTQAIHKLKELPLTPAP